MGKANDAGSYRAMTSFLIGKFGYRILYDFEYRSSYSLPSTIPLRLSRFVDDVQF